MAYVRHASRRALLAASIVAGLTLSAGPGDVAAAQPAPPPPPVSGVGRTLPTMSPSPSPEPPSAKNRDAVLGVGWQASTDRAWTTTGDADGFHVLVAEEKAGYAWRTVATLTEPGFEADSWIGNACVTRSGRRAIVVYAPRTFTNKAHLFARGGFTALVDLDTGKVTKLPVQASLAYYNPGCGADEAGVLTQGGAADKAATRLVRVDAAKGRLDRPLSVPGQVTSAVPLADGAIAAADGARIVRITRTGERTTLTDADSVPFNLRVDAAGGVVFLDHHGDNARVRRLAPTGGALRRGSVATLAHGPLTGVGLGASAGGVVFITGTATADAALPATVRVTALDRQAQPSTQGMAAVISTRWADGRDSRVAADAGGAGAQTRPVDVGLAILDTGRSFVTTADPGAGRTAYAAQGRAASPQLAAGRTAKSDLAASGSPTDPVESERTCSVPRNDPGNQVLQPKPRQVEWAVDQAVMGTLNDHIRRPANWKGLGMPAYQPQTLFPRIPVAGGDHVPAQVMLGITAQESNMRQATSLVIPGVTANPLIGNYYGRQLYNDSTADDWAIDFAVADCGYGVTQVTDHMRLAGREKNAADTAWAYQTQRAVALDYTVNIAAGLRILTEKWNITRAANMILNNGDPNKPENWFYALWAYNSGFHPLSAAGENGGAWGVGWFNNPANPEYPAGRLPFMEFSYADAAHPQDWPYPEKVLGFAAHPPELLESPGVLVPGFRAAWWNGGGTIGVSNRQKVKPPVHQFCDASNQCTPGAAGGPCAHRDNSGTVDFKCWYHQPSTWKPTCVQTCGFELNRFDSTYAEQADGTAYPPNCSLAGLPAGALVVDNTPAASVRPNCARPTANSGSFALSFPADRSGNYPAKVDLHQLGGGFGGHAYWGHTRLRGDQGGDLKITGTWTFASAHQRWGRLLVHLPDHHAHAQQARYQIDTGAGGFTEIRYVNQKRRANNWVSLGVYQFTGVPRVRLDTETEDGTGEDDIMFDAVAFQPLPGKPKHVVAVLGDSYTSGEGAGDYLTETNIEHGTSEWNACRRSRNAWGRRTVLPGTTEPLGVKADRFDTDVELGFVACSGARTSNVWDAAWSASRQTHGEGQFNEINQVRSGVVTKDTTLVVLSVGGNDGAAFANAMQECAGLSDCSLDPTFLPRYQALADRAVTATRTVVTDIRRRAPSAQIILMGYPELLSRTVKCAGSLWYDLPEAAAIATLVNHLAGEQQKLVDSLRATDGSRIAYANPVPTFVGHAGCDSDEWMNMIVLGPKGDGDFHVGDPASQACLWPLLGGACLSRESFHPNARGTGSPGYASVLRERLDAIGYTGS